MNTLIKDKFKYLQEISDKNVTLTIDNMFWRKATNKMTGMIRNIYELFA